jgi:hypothetical protein
MAEILLILSSPRLQNPSIEGGLDLDRVQDLALNVCGLAFTNESVAARVNAFGPLTFCK